MGSEIRRERAGDSALRSRYTSGSALSLGIAAATFSDKASASDGGTMERKTLDFEIISSKGTSAMPMAAARAFVARPRPARHVVTE